MLCKFQKRPETVSWIFNTFVTRYLNEYAGFLMKHNKCLTQWPGCTRSFNVLLKEVSKETPSVLHFCTNELSGSDVQVVVSSPIFHFLNAAPANENTDV